MPLGVGSTSSQFGIDGLQEPDDRRTFYLREVLPGYFEALDVPILAGRTLDIATAASSEKTVIVSALAAKSMFGDAPALGRLIRFPYKNGELRKIIGVVGDVRHRGASEAPKATVYVPHGQIDWASITRRAPRPTRMAVVVRAVSDAAALRPLLRAAAQETGQPAIVQTIRSGDELLGATVSTTRKHTTLLTLLGALGLLLALVGVFGVTSYAVTRRTREIGVRMAFGARPRDVVITMVKDAALPIAAGIAVGFAGAWFLTNVIATFLYETTPHDPVTFTVVAIVLSISGTLAAWIPARRAARVDPVVALRAD
jgi:hypothetical protein